MPAQITLPQNGSHNICIYASSSDAINSDYMAAAADLGARLAQAGHTLVYGGGGIGLMGAVARAAQAAGGRVVGVIPEKLLPQGYDGCDEFIVTADMRARKAEMEMRADAFIALPGGFGTLEEVLEVITLKQLRYHEKPVVLLNTRGFYDPLLGMFARLYDEQFTWREFAASYHVAPDAADALAHIAAYTPPDLPWKVRPPQA